MSTQPFCFLDLPAELRCIVYEHIDISIHRQVVSSESVSGKASQIVLIRRCLPVSLLAACKLINHESMAVFTTKLREMQNDPLRF
ncbi:hypothetical protein EK21DRAFT_20903, partial [Setomelanomma holmii]